jgi:hypothetical protein
MEGGDSDRMMASTPPENGLWRPLARITSCKCEPLHISPIIVTASAAIAAIFISDGRIRPGSARQVDRRHWRRNAAVALRHGGEGFDSARMAPECITILLAPVRFLNRLRTGLILTPRGQWDPRGRLDRSRQKCRGDGFGCDGDIWAFCSSREYQAPFILRPQAPDRSARRRAVRLRGQAAAASGSGSAAGHGRAADQTHRHGLG